MNSENEKIPINWICVKSFSRRFRRIRNCLYLKSDIKIKETWCPTHRDIASAKRLTRFQVLKMQYKANGIKEHIIFLFSKCSGHYSAELPESQRYYR